MPSTQKPLPFYVKITGSKFPKARWRTMELNVILFSLSELPLPAILRFQIEMLSVGKWKPFLLPPSPHLLHNDLGISLEVKHFCAWMNLGPFNTEVYVNMCHPECMRSSSIPRVKCPGVPFTMPSFHPITGTPSRHGSKKNHRSVTE